MIQLMAANWKMFKTRGEARATAQTLAQSMGAAPKGREVLVIPPFTALGEVSAAFEHRPGFFSGGQNFYPADKGAFTGEISPVQLLDAGATHALTGHSERRHVLGESDEFIGEKTAYGLNSGLCIILCIGEKIEERKAGNLTAVLERQLATGLKDVPTSVDPARLCVAYEPVWAIGTGEVAGPADIVEAHGFIRAWLNERFGKNGSEMRILYGGSVKPDNASEIMGLDNVDGVLVGGASLEAESFGRIVSA